MTDPVIFWLSIVLMTIAGFVRHRLALRLRQEVAGQHTTPASPQPPPEYRVRDLLKRHQSIYPASNTRKLYSVALGISMISAVTGIIAITAAQFQPGNTLHLFPVAR